MSGAEIGRQAAHARRGATDPGQHRQAAGVIADAVIRSVGLIVQTGENLPCGLLGMLLPWQHSEGKNARQAPNRPCLHRISPKGLPCGETIQGGMGDLESRRPSKRGRPLHFWPRRTDPFHLRFWAVARRRRGQSRNNLRASKEDPPRWSRRGGKVRSLGEETRRAYHRFASTLKASTPLPDRRSSFGQAESRCVEPSV